MLAERVPGLLHDLDLRMPWKCLPRAQLLVPSHVQNLDLLDPVQLSNMAVDRCAEARDTGFPVSPR
jgi:hypothetical protein